MRRSEERSGKEGSFDGSMSVSTDTRTDLDNSAEIKAPLFLVGEQDG